MRALACLAAVFVMAACTAPDGPRRAPAPQLTLPAMKSFAPARAQPPTRSNIAMAQDFLDLSFQLESGRALPALSRFEGPITLRVLGDQPPTMRADLAALLSRLRREAGISITPVAPQTQANITIQVLRRAQLQRFVPQAACFVMPRVSDWQDYRRNSRSRKLEWATLTTRKKVAIFLPGDVSPQELRDCLHEELAQALGPLNDLYRLPDSVFNDDNFHGTLTGFDMLMLRLYYAPELRSGMKRKTVEARLPALLARLNPGGEGRGGAIPGSPTPEAWKDAVQTALGPNSRDAARRKATIRMIEIAKARGWRDVRLGFGHFLRGRMAAPNEGEVAFNAFATATGIFASPQASSPLRRAQTAPHLAAFALSSGRADLALELINVNLAPLMQAQNAHALAIMLMLKAEALEALNRPSEARSVRLDSLGWARYGMGSEQDIRRRLRDIAALRPGGSS